MIAVAFFLPLGLYLLALGVLNRRPTPVLVRGTWDCLGLLFALSGFLLFGGPAVLTSLHEHWRWFWLLGEGPPKLAGPSESAPWFWLLSGAYFLAVVAGVSSLLRRSRRRTSLYNIDPDDVELMLERAFGHLGLAPVRSGDLYVFGIDLPVPAWGRRVSPRGLQGPHYAAVAPPAPRSAPPERHAAELLGQEGVLEVDTFAALRHVTLRWDPADSLLRQSVEAFLARELAQTPSPDHDTGLWLHVFGLTILSACVLASVVLAVRAVYGS